MAVFRIEAYAYSEGPRGSGGVAAGASAALQTVQTLAVVESATPGTTTYERPAVPVLFSDLLALWAADLSQAAPWGAPAGTYSCTYDSGTRRVTLQTTNAVQFKPVAIAGELAFVGLTQAIGGFAVSWTGASVPFGVAELLGVTVEPAEDWAVVDLDKYRHGRAVAAAWGNHAAHRVKLYALGDARAALSGGYLTAGRVRIYQGDTGAAYSATNVDGYVDGWVVASGELQTEGDDEDLWTLDLVVAVAR
jgi:hypothetical protein